MKRTITLIIFTLVGSGLSVFSVNLWRDQINLVNTGTESVGNVIEMIRKNTDDGTMYTPVIEYQYENRVSSFVSRLSSSSPKYKLGESVKILIPKDGNTPQINSFMSLWLGPIIMSFMGIIFTLIGLVSIMKIFRKKSNLKKLDTRGVIIQTTNPTVINGMKDSLIKNKGAIKAMEVVKKMSGTATILKTQWMNPDDSKVYVFYSDNLQYDPTPYLGETVGVKILPNNPKIYRFENLPDSGNVIVD